jgi:hypothetical protein
MKHLDWQAVVFLIMCAIFLLKVFGWKPSYIEEWRKEEAKNEQRKRI